MSDYGLTAGQQQGIIDFLNAGGSVYIEGNDFGYFHDGDPVYDMFGCVYVDDGNSTNNVQDLSGQDRTLMDDASATYTYGSDFPDQYVDLIDYGGGDILFECQGGSGRVVAYPGPDGSYRAIHSAVWLGAMIDNSSSHTKTQVMAAYMNFLKGDTLVCSIDDEISCATGGDTVLMGELTPSESGMSYFIGGSLSGTTPGLMINGVHIPLNWDNFTVFVMDNVNKPMFTDFAGYLSTKGRGSGLLDSMGPLNPGLAGRTLSFALVLIQPVTYASNAVSVDIVP